MPCCAQVEGTRVAPSETHQRDHKDWAAFYDRIVADFGSATLTCECDRDSGDRPGWIDRMLDNMFYTSPETGVRLTFLFHTTAVLRGALLRCLCRFDSFATRDTPATRCPVAVWNPRQAGFRLATGGDTAALRQSSWTSTL